jgi:hypothetical protein
LIADIYNIIDPDDETLKAALFQYAKERLGTDQRLARLEAEHNVSIKSVVVYMFKSYLNSQLYL